jgi:hypothetical protein
MHNSVCVCFGVCVCGLIHVTLGWAEKGCTWDCARVTPGSVQPSINSAFSPPPPDYSQGHRTLRRPCPIRSKRFPGKPSVEPGLPISSHPPVPTSSQGSSTFSVYSLQRSSSIPISTGPTLSGPGTSPSRMDDDELTAEDDMIMASIYFLSLAGALLTHSFSLIIVVPVV